MTRHQPGQGRFVFCSAPGHPTNPIALEVTHEPLDSPRELHWRLPHPRLVRGLGAALFPPPDDSPEGHAMTPR
jgi:hypothetical protein